MPINKPLPSSLTSNQRDRLNRQLKDKLRSFHNVKEVDLLDFTTLPKIHSIIYEFLVTNFTPHLDETTFSIGFQDGFKIIIKSSKIHYIWYTLLGKKDII